MSIEIPQTAEISARSSTSGNLTVLNVLSTPAMTIGSSASKAAPPSRIWLSTRCALAAAAGSMNAESVFPTELPGFSPASSSAFALATT